MVANINTNINIIMIRSRTSWNLRMSILHSVSKWVAAAVREERLADTAEWPGSWDCHVSSWFLGLALKKDHLGEEEDHVCHSPHNALRAWDERVKLQFRAFFSKRHQHPCRRYYISWRSPSRPWRWWGALGCTWWWPPFFSPPPPSMIIFILP